ncbi:hypothetical protein EHJ37_19740 [Vibrio parahaemolyticus]|nr:hypothetical protein [Vibrio parahaemolyticus]
MSKIPINTAATDALNDAGSLTPAQVEQKVNTEIEKERAIQAKRDAVWQKISSCKSPKDYKDLIDQNFDSVDYLLELLETKATRTTILNSTRLSPSDYLKLKLILKESDSDLKDFLVESINTAFTNLTNKQ